MRIFIKHLIELVLSPNQGWADLSDDIPDSRYVEIHGLFPWLGIVALSSVFGLLYNTVDGFTGFISTAIITLGMYFLGYYVAVLSMSCFAENYIDSTSADFALNGPVYEARIKILVAYCVGILALFKLIENCLPSHLTLLHFLPFYVGIVVWKGMNFMQVKKEYYAQYLLVSIISIIAPPYIAGTMLGWLL